jgi:hypothetical protein
MHIQYIGKNFISAMETKDHTHIRRTDYFNIKISTNILIRNSMHRLCHCIQYFQNITRTYTKGVNVILLISMRKVWPPFSNFTPFAYKLSVIIQSRNPCVWLNSVETRRGTKWITTKSFCIWGKFMIVYNILEAVHKKTKKMYFIVCIYSKICTRHVSNV